MSKTKRFQTVAILRKSEQCLEIFSLSPNGLNGRRWCSPREHVFKLSRDALFGTFDFPIHKELNEVTNQLPEVFYYYFRDISTVHSYETRSKTNKSLFLPRVNLNYGQFGVKYAAIKTWNETPNEIRASKSTTAFRKKYKDFPLSQ